MNQALLFSFIDLISIGFWFTILLFIANSLKQKYYLENLNQYFYLGWGFKVGFAVLFALIYLFYLGGGDINAYWDSATALNKLFISNPSAYLQEICNTDRLQGIALHFNTETGFPPGWIWRETEAWNASKLLSILSIVTFNSFWCATLLLSSLVFFISWMLLYRIHSEGVFGVKSLAFAFLFLPSVTFWCSGISKDSQVYALALFLIFLMFEWLKWNPERRGITRLILLVIVFYILYQLRHFVALSIVVPFVSALAVRFGNRWSERPIILWVFRIVVLAMIIVGFIYLSDANATQKMIQEAQIIQTDFSQNPIYTGAKYEITSMDGSITSLFLAIPEAVFIALYRPFITENIGGNFLINQIESLIFILFTIAFVFNRNLFTNVRSLIKNEFAVFSLIFVLLIAFMAGYTSILFGVLVRIRAIALPFFFLLLTYRSVQPKHIE